MFEWTEFYEAIAEKLLDYRNDRMPLIEGIHEIASRVDKLSYLKDDKGPLEDICPFTTMGTFNRDTKKRKEIATEMARLLEVDVPVPDAFKGIPTLNNQNSMFFEFSKKRKDGDIDTLWNVFTAAKRYLESDDDRYRVEFVEAYAAAIKVKRVKWRLTTGLYWAYPRNFVTLDTNSRQYINKQFGQKLKENTLPEAETYLKLVDELKDRFNDDDCPVHSFQELSLKAWSDKDKDETDPVHDNEHHQEPDNQRSIRVPAFHKINEQLEKAGYFPPDLCRQLHLGLCANSKRHFAILTGISGSGKTLLARKYAEALTGTKKPPHVCVVPVQPGWTDPSFLLGYPNPLKGDSYERTRFLELLLSAKDKPGLPHVVILDEMNLSHPEQYLAPVLSAMETGKDVELHGREGDFDGVPRSIPYPSNLVLVGTVNMDETTMGLSDKVLDRAFTLEFWDINVDAWPGWNSHGLSEDRAEQVKVLLNELMTALKPARLHFGYRVIGEVLAFLKQREQQTPDWDFTGALDAVIYAKVLPKLRGDDSSRIQKAFDECGKVLDKHELKKCAEKVEELIADLESTGSARFWR